MGMRSLIAPPAANFSLQKRAQGLILCWNFKGLSKSLDEGNIHSVGVLVVSWEAWYPCCGQSASLNPSREFTVQGSCNTYNRYMLVAEASVILI